MSDGRWPANLITDGSEEVKACFPETTSGNPNGARRNVSGTFLAHANGVDLTGYGDTGNASRFFAACPPDEGDYESDGESSVMPDNVALYLGDCRDVLREFARMNGTGPRFTAIVTDPPAGISFMGREFDTDYGGRDNWIAIYAEIARLALDLCLPGAHALVWALPRTSHWTATAWENGGWEVRDRIQYASSKDAKVAAFLASLDDEQRKALEVIEDESRVSHCFGSGFPKSLDVSKALDKAAGAEREVVGYKPIAYPDSDCWGTPNSHSSNKGVFAGHIYGDGEQEVGFGQGSPITAPATALAREWDGYGSALKPAVEDWWLLRKPLDGTIAGNCSQFGCGALNIDGCRIPTTDKHEYPNGPGGTPNAGAWASSEVSSTLHKREGAWSMQENGGRFPANLIHDGSDEVTACFPVTTQNGYRSNPTTNKTTWFGAKDGSHIEGERGFSDTGSAARFFAVCPPDASRIFYAAKASRSEREAGCEGLEERGKLMVKNSAQNVDSRPGRNDHEQPQARGANHHPTVKPLALMRYLLTLLRQPTVNLVLDPFMGSGSTGVAAVMLGIPFVGIERDPEYFEIARRRIAHAQAQAAARPLTEQLPLLAETEDV